MMIIGRKYIWKNYDARAVSHIKPKRVVQPVAITCPIGIPVGKDHPSTMLRTSLRNIRVTVDQSGNIVTKDDYYPFGLQMGGLSYNAGNTNDRLKYSGKELDEEAGLSKYHFGWREYDAELGRWNRVDPLSREYPGWSPYNYVKNSPFI